MRTDVTKAPVCVCPLDTETVTECCLLVRNGALDITGL